MLFNRHLYHFDPILLELIEEFCNQYSSWVSECLEIPGGVETDTVGEESQAVGWWFIFLSTPSSFPLTGQSFLTSCHTHTHTHGRTQTCLHRFRGSLSYTFLICRNLWHSLRSHTTLPSQLYELHQSNSRTRRGVGAGVSVRVCLHATTEQQAFSPRDQFFTFSLWHLWDAYCLECVQLTVRDGVCACFGAALSVNKAQRGRSQQDEYFELTGTSELFPHTDSAVNLLHVTDRWPFSSLPFTQYRRKWRLLVQQTHVAPLHLSSDSLTPARSKRNSFWHDDWWAWLTFSVPSKPQSSMWNALLRSLAASGFINVQRLPLSPLNLFSFHSF